MDGTGLELVGRLVVSLAVVLALMALAAAVLRRRGMPGAVRRTPVAIEVVGRQGLSRGASIAVVRTAGRALVLGVTDSSVQVLAEADLADIEPEPAPPTARRALGRASSDGGTIVERLRDMTVRRT